MSTAAAPIADHDERDVTHPDIAGRPAERRGAEHKYLIAVAVVLASLMQVIDSSIVNVALPDMMGNLGANLDEIAWVSTGYILASVIVIPLTGFLGDLFGRKRYFVGSIIVFTASSFFCGASHSLGALIFWRIVQGVGGGALMTVSQAVLFESFPPEEAGMAMALFGLGVMVGPTIGPTLGGYLVDNSGWPWIFYINIPVGILAATMIAAYVHDPAHQKKPSTIDYLGITLLIMSVGAIQFVLEHGEREDWFESRQILSLAVIGVLGWLALMWRELTTDHPAIDFRVLRHRQMWVGTLLGVVMGVGLYAMSFTLPVFLQSNLHMTAQQTGIVLLPGAVATALSMVVVGRLTNRVDPRLLIATGAVLFALAARHLSLITGESGAHDFFWPLIGRGIGLGMMFVPLTTITLAQLTPAELPQGVGLYSFFRQLGGSFGIAAIATLVTRYTAQFRAVLGEHVARNDPVALGRVEMLTRGMMARGADQWTAHQRALMLVDRQLFGQASVIAYGRIYMIAAGLILLLIPLLLLVRQTKGAGGDHVMVE
ncbi:MAG TPA: DHA2 family efflux MFS transporter permease subunit [Gemmatimonadaceae bacterium]|jgi:DHA2 family multidrug resistance protein|nr:DHA2 family efflux MFS transporter permease subunit [Gemmatimonadaceae bacterium]